MNCKRLYRWALPIFLLVLMACTCGSLPTQLAQNATVVANPTIADTLPTATLALPTSTSNATAIIATATPVSAPQFDQNGVRICDYVPGVSKPAQMPSDVTNAPLPTPFPLPTEPPT